jgi:hypothetical protein
LIFSLRPEPFALRHFETSDGRVAANDLLCVVLIMISLVNMTDVDVTSVVFLLGKKIAKTELF